MKVVLDTNVLVSALLNGNSLPAQIVNLALSGKLQVLYTNPILDEYSRVLSRKKFSFPSSLIEPLLDFIRYEGELVLSEPVSDEFDDQEDKKFYEARISGNGQYLITGNLKHFPQDSRILNPRDFIGIYTGQASK